MASDLHLCKHQEKKDGNSQERQSFVAQFLKRYLTSALEISEICGYLEWFKLFTRDRQRLGIIHLNSQGRFIGRGAVIMSSLFALLILGCLMAPFGLGTVHAARFVVQDSHIEDIPVKVLVNVDTTESVSILPTHGGRVEQVRMKSPVSGRVRDVILTHNGNATAIKENTLFKGAILLPFANRIAGVSFFSTQKCYPL